MDTTHDLLGKLWDLLQLPAAERTDEWHETVAQAALVAPLEPFDGGAQSSGPDGLRYYAGGFPRAEGDYDAIHLKDALEFFVSQLSGFVIESPEPNKPFYVFTHGDILSLHLYGQLHVKWGAPWDQPGFSGVVERVMQITVGAPNEEMLPQVVRNSMRELLKLALHIDEPKVLVVRLDKDGASDLVFNVFPEQFAKEGHYQWAQAAVTGFLPRHLRIRTIFVEEATFANSPWTAL